MTKKIVLVLMCFIFVGCSYKVDPFSLNIENKNLIGHEYNTYNKKEQMISTYFFKKDKKNLKMSYFITYLPYDVDGELYSVFSSLKYTLDRYSNHSSSTIESVLEKNVAKNGYKKLFKNKDEFLIDNDLASDLIREINKYKDKQERDDKDDRFLWRFF